VSETLSLVYKPGGPVLRDFMRSQKPVQPLMGPVGGGKTRAVLTKGVKCAQRQRPSTRDGLRKFKLCVVRDTYRDLWRSTIPSWWKVIPKNVGEWVGAEGDPVTHTIDFALADGTRARYILQFVAIGDQAVEDVLRGYEVSAFYLNEADRLSRDVFTYARSRTGRFPDMDEGGPTWHGIFADYNAPDTENWTFTDFDDKRADDVDFFRQPSGLSPQAENLMNLPPDYYKNMIKGQPDWWVRRFVRNEYGYSRDGLPVYGEWVDSMHVAEIEPIPGLKLLIGADAGLTPAAAIGQRLPSGRWLILAEVIGEKGMGARRFGRMLGQYVREHFSGFMSIEGYADPSAAYGADRQNDEQDWIEMVQDESGLWFMPAPSNNLTPRLTAVREPLTQLIDGKPAFLLHPRCTQLRKGFNSGYRYRRMQIPGMERYDDKPEKNEYSHPHDALQYLMLGGGSDYEIGDRRDRLSSSTRQTTAISTDHPRGEWGNGNGGRQRFAINEE
jgi:hypothetical protein